MKTFKDMLKEGKIDIRQKGGSTQPSAQDRYDHHKARALKHLDRLKGVINNMHKDTGKSGQVDWGHVGSMEHIHHTLRDTFQGEDKNS